MMSVNICPGPQDVEMFLSLRTVDVLGGYFFVGGRGLSCASQNV